MNTSLANPDGGFCGFDLNYFFYVYVGLTTPPSPQKVNPKIKRGLAEFRVQSGKTPTKTRAFGSTQNSSLGRVHRLAVTKHRATVPFWACLRDRSGGNELGSIAWVQATGLATRRRVRSAKVSRLLKKVSKKAILLGRRAWMGSCRENHNMATTRYTVILSGAKARPPWFVSRPLSRHVTHIDIPKQQKTPGFKINQLDSA